MVPLLGMEFQDYILLGLGFMKYVMGSIARVGVPEVGKRIPW